MNRSHYIHIYIALAALAVVGLLLFINTETVIYHCDAALELFELLKASSTSFAYP